MEKAELNRPDSGLWGILILTLAMVLVCLASMCSGCSRKVIETQVVEVPRIEHHYSNTTRCDTIREKDSVIIVQRGDTIYSNSVKHYYHTTFRHDTVSRCDTLTQVIKVPVPQYIEKELTWWQKTRMKAGNVAIFALGAGILGGGFWVWRRIRKAGKRILI